MPEIPNTQWRFLLIAEGGDVRGTNDEKVADAANECDVVIEVPTCKVLRGLGQDARFSSIEEQNWYIL